MSYCTQADIEKLIPVKELARLTDDAAGQAVATAVVDDAVIRSSSLIDSYCAARYQTPFVDPPPAVIRDLCAVLAAYELQARRPQTMPEEWRKRRDDAVKTLLLITKGEVVLPGALSAQGEAVTVPAALFVGSARLFSRETIDNG